MADLTTLEEKLAEVTGLAAAAQETAKKVEALLDDGDLAATVRKLQAEGEEAESRCVDVAEGFPAVGIALGHVVQDEDRPASGGDPWIHPWVPGRTRPGPRLDAFGGDLGARGGRRQG